MEINRLQPCLEESFSRLPSHATEASRLRYAIAQLLAEAAPLTVTFTKRFSLT